MEEIETILDKMEEKDLSLEDSFRLYENGMKKLKPCSDKIDQVEKKMIVISGEGGSEVFE